MLKEKKIGFLVSSNYEEKIARATQFREEFGLLEPIFKTQGFKLEKLIWAEAKNLEDYIAIIPKAVWDYFERIPEFKTFLRQIDVRKLKMINPVEVVQWNMDKNYLKDIRAQGLPVLDFEIYSQGSAMQLSELKSFPESSKLLLKPCVSGGARRTFLSERAKISELQEQIEIILKDCDLMVQPFYKEVASGEYSFFFFGEEFSHAIIKIPAAGDFRAHSYFKAVNKTYHPSPEEISAARKFIFSAPKPCAYARVDLLKVAGEFSLVELELIEPYLYMNLASDEKASSLKFVKAICSAAESNLC